MICPATSTTPFPHDQWSVTELNGNNMETYMRWLAIAYLPTMALACGVVVPCGLDHMDMPFGIQVLSAQGNDRLVAEVAKALEITLSKNQETMRPLPDLEELVR